MAIGPMVRQSLGPRAFTVVGRAYRSIFVDLDKVARATVRHIPDNALVLDVGGGDGEPLNHIMALRSDIRVTMIDLSPTIGQSVRDTYRNRVDVMPETSVRQYYERNGAPPQVVLINDVLHHVPVPSRPAFFHDLGLVMRRGEGIRLIIKDVEPGGLRATLGYLADRYISGDRHVSLVSRATLVSSLESSFGAISITETTLYSDDSPNYSLVCTLRSTSAAE